MVLVYYVDYLELEFTLVLRVASLERMSWCENAWKYVLGTT